MGGGQSADGTLPVGYVLDDYRIVAVLGQGGFGITYKARDDRLERFVAIKEYLPRQWASRDADSTVRPRSDGEAETFHWGLSRFIDEARALARFKHPNIVAVIRYLEANGTAYLVMEYEEGLNLEHWISARAAPPPEDELIGRILLPLLDGLERIHAAGLLHRDIKPENVFVRGDGSPVLIDFGASRAQSGASNLTSIVSAGYSPFEQYGSGEGQGPWSDLYALAGTMYRVVVGRAPTDAISRFQSVAHRSAVEAAAGRYSGAFLAAIDRTLSLEAADRPQSAAELRALLTGAAHETVLAGRSPPRRGRSMRAATLTGALAAVMLAGGYYFFGTSRVPAPRVPASAEVGMDDVALDVGAQGSGTHAAAMPVIVEDDAPPPAAAVRFDEDRILDGLDLSDAVRAYRQSQIGGALLAYVTNRERFDECVVNGCSELANHMIKVQEALDGYAWRSGNAAGQLRVANPRVLDRDDCRFLLDVVEELDVGAERREQTRVYCTTNGFDRALQSEGAVKTIG